MPSFQLPSTLVHALQRHAAQQPDALALRFLDGDEGVVLSYGELDLRARTIAAALQAQAGQGERAVLLFESGPAYVTAFFGCLYAGVIAVPAYPPESSRHQHQQRLLSIIDDAQPRLVLTSADQRDALLHMSEALSAANAPTLLCVDSLDSALASDWQQPDLQPDAIAFLQYTSGSTALPKGVQVSHGNLVANELLIRQGFGIAAGDVIVSWLPLYHDMGLIGGLLQPIFSGVPCVLMSPKAFLERPVRWLEAISQYGGTVSGGPDFAYRLCSERVSASALSRLNLGSWRVAFSGSEPIRQDSLERFAVKFAGSGFSADSYLACYGLAEATLYVTSGQRGAGIPSLGVSGAALARNHLAPGSDSLLMSCGVPRDQHQVRIVEPGTLQVLGENQVGEIWASGPSIAHGYWRNPEASAQTFVQQDGYTWLRTGDLGALRDGELYISGRLKDMLIVRGHNLYPQDIERTVETEVAHVRKGRVAAFAVQQDGEEGIGIAAEIGRSVQKNLPAEQLINAIRQAVAEAYQEAPRAVILLNPGALPKTSSGKLQRSACRQGLADGTLDSYAQFPLGYAARTTGSADGRGAHGAPYQQQIAAIWANHLRLESVSARDNFFLLGGNSIAAAQVMAELRNQLGVSLELRHLFETRDLAGFTAKVAEQLAQGATSEDAIPRLPRNQNLVQSPAQNRLWFLWQLDPHSAAYNIPGGLHLRGELNAAAVRSSFARLIQRHEALRTVFLEEQGEALQRIQPSAELRLREVDLSHLSGSEQAEQAAAIREQQASAPFDLHTGPLLRVTLVRLDDEEHQLLVTLHHIVADGWSLNLLLDEFSRLYAEACGGQSADLVPLPLGYADFASWQRQWLANGEAQRQLDYWTRQLGDQAPALDLPLDHPRSAQRQHSAARYTWKLDDALSQRLREVAQGQQSTLFMLLLAAFQTLLLRHTGQRDLRIGVPGANRQRLETQGLLGFFINTLVLRGQLDSRQPFTELLGQTRQTTLDAQANQDLPFDQLVQALGGAAPFQVMFNYQQRDLGSLRRLPGLLAQELPWHSREAKFDLQLHSEEDGRGRLTLSFDYADELLEKASIQRLAKRLVSLLQQVAEQPETALGDIQLLDEQEQQQLAQWRQAPMPAATQLLPQQLEQQAKHSAASTALLWQNGQLSYAELHAQADVLAQHLRQLGVGPDVCVAIAAERSPQLLIGLLAIIKAGGAYVPLDIDYPRERLAYMLEDSGVRLLLTQAHLRDSLPVPPHVQVLEVGCAVRTEAITDARGTHGAPCLAGDNLAYVIYTSGSTGQPKGVGVTHAALAERLAWMQATYQLDASDVLLQKAPVSFDVSVWECFWPLITGARLLLAAPGEHRDPQRLVQLVREYGVTTLHFVPPLLQLFVQEAEVAQCSSLRRLFSGGEALPAALRDRLLTALPHVALHNRYGPTETAINVTHWHCQLSDGERSPIGRPLGNVLCQVLDADLQPVPPGVAGELCIGGVGMARGYLGRPGLTAERFVPDPLGAPGTRLYRTGDRVRWGADGALEYLGRLDQQVKLRGFRIEPEEIQARLLAETGVGQAVVLVREGHAGPQLVGYYTSSTDESEATQTQRLLAALQAQLPDYMVPSQLMRLAQMPLNPAGKLDRRALPEPVLQQRHHIEPITPLQQQVAAIWREVLGVHQVGLADDFFELGGHSLVATQIVSRARQACDVELPLRALFEASTLQGFCAQIEAAQQAGQRNSQQAIALVDRRQPQPLSYSQQRMWFLWQLEPHSPAYNVGGLARFSGALDVARFEAALQALIQRHETLRTTFPSQNGIARQQVEAQSTLRLGWQDYSRLPSAERQQRLEQFADADAHQPFDLESGPLLRASIIKCAEREHYLVLTLHHIATEGWAMDIFARELAALYEAFVDERESPLAPLAVQYLDYSQWQRQWMEGGERERQLAYWTAQLGNEHPVLELPSDRPRPPVQSHRGELYRFDLSADLAQRLRAFNAANGLTLFMTMTATLAILLNRYSGQNDLRIGAPVANRIRPESEGLIGAFLNTQVLRCQVDGQLTVSQWLEQVRHTVIDGQSHQDLPFDQLVEALQPPRSAAYNPLFQVMCNVQRWEFQQTRELAGMTVEYIANDARATKFDLNLEVTDLDHRLGCCFTYSGDLFDEPRIAGMATHLVNLLEAMLAAPQQRLSELPLLGADEQQALLDNLAAEQGEHALDQTLHQLFAAQAAATPNAPALTFADTTLSYAELDAQANRLAHLLRERGVGPEVRVGLALQRSTEMVVGLLAILKAGGAYVPLDPEYPLERLHYMLEDSGIRLLLGHQQLLEALGELPQGVSSWSLENDGAGLADYPASPPVNVSSPLHQAYLIYTSGSTGKPKGVVVSHGEIAMHCRAVIERFGMRSDDCELHFYSINFDAASERLLSPLLCGAHVLLRGQGQWGAEDICALIRQHQVSILGFTPSYGSQLAQWLASRNEQLPVRLCITGGEALTAEHLQRIRGGFAPAQFFNAYGPTETVVMPLASLAPQQVAEGASSVAIGSIVGARLAYVLDADLALVPPGATGELYIGGAGLARGYHARPALTAERFVPNPFANSAAGGRLYRTGDLVRQRADGLLEYVGRIDQQVKVRGFRIELGEIEARLLEHSAVSECVVLALDAPSGKQLVGYVGTALANGSAEQQALRDSLKAHLLAQLPEHMLPSHLLLLPSLPLTANGKVERRALPAPDLEQNRQQYVAPRSEMEQRLAAIWREVLNVSQVGLADNFFELGGDSILSIQVVSRARQQGIHFSPRDLFQHQTVQALAHVASHQQVLLSEQGPLTGEAALTPIQHWFFDTEMSQRQHWNQALVLQPQQALDTGLLRQALRRLLQQHDALRLRFSQQAGQWQATYDEQGAEQPLLWHAQVQHFDQAPELFADAQRSLDLHHGPLLRAVLVDGPEGGQKLLLSIHHLVVDGVSWRVLLEDLQSIYRQLQAGETTLQLPAKTSAMGEWGARLAAYAGSESLREELSWWQRQLRGASAALPCDRPDGSNRQRDAQTVSVRLDAERTRQLLTEAPAAYRTQVNDLLLTALARVLSRHSGQPSALVQLEGHGREALFDELDLTRSVGWFTSAYPLQLRVEDDLGTAIKTIKEQLRAVPHKGLGYGVLRYLADPLSREALAELPQARVTFNYLGQFDQSFADDALLRPLEDSPGAAHDPDSPLPNQLSIDSQVYGGELQLRWTYSRERYEQSSVQALANELLNELHGIIAHCLQADSGGLTPSDFPLAHLSQEQLDHLPVSAAQIDDIYPLTPMQEGLLLHTLLEPGTGIYYMQDRYRINSALDGERFAQAWQAVVGRHEALRASFVWNAGEAMLQIIHKPGAADLEVLDWSALPAEQHEERLQALHKREREAGFELLQRPPFHLRLIKLEAERYWFMMSNHHILIDAWCRGLLMSDFFEIYAALGEQRAPRLQPAPRYRDYIGWLQRQSLEQARQWWQGNLAGFERRTHLPSDRPILQEHAGATGGMLVGDRYSRLLASQGAQLRELAQRHQLTVNTFAQAAWALVLRRYSGERDVLFGVTVAGRPVGMPEMQRTVGLFINSVALRVKLPGVGEKRPVREWLQGLLASNMDLREHEFLPLVAIQECSELPKGQPLFDSLFVFENAPVESGVLDQAQSLKATSDSGRTHTNFPLTVVCYPGDDLGLHLSYDQRYFDEETIDTLLGEFQRLLLALAEHFHGDMADLPLLSEAEQRLLTVDCNQSEHTYPLEQGYARLFEAQVAAGPQRVAASCLEQQWSYSELNRRANKLGHALLGAGVRIDQPVALLAERSLDLLGMIVGSFKAGAGYLPLDPGHPVQRLTRIIELSRTPLLVCSRACREQATQLLEELGCGGRPRLLVWEDIQAGQGPQHNPGIYSAANNLAYVIYTSGSTGLPKGVMVEQAGMLNNQLSKVPYLNLSADDVIAQTASQSFDISVWQFLAAPLFGARVAIVPNAIAHDPQALLAHVREQRISVLESVPSLIQGMLAEAVEQQLGALRWMLPTGEAMPPELARQWLQRFPEVALVNAYGPAECSDDVAFFRVDQASTEGSYLPIGSPTDNNRLYLLDEALELVPLGAVGELCVAGTGVGRGYVGDPSRTAQAFVPNPFAAGQRLYRSGDLARRRADGVLEYVGRIDHQVKIRGFRIELGEIEARLHEQAQVREAAVAVQEGPSGKYLVGYLVASQAQDAASPATQVLEHSLWFEQIKQRLRAELPDYMVPLHWQVLERMPLNANGKLDRKALPALELGALASQAYVAPRNQLEQQLADIWAQVLKVERVGVHDNFFELGGHSLLATQIASRVQKVLQKNVPLRAMFECSSVAELAEYVGSLDSALVSEQKAEKLSDLMARLEAM